MGKLIWFVTADCSINMPPLLLTVTEACSDRPRWYEGDTVLF